MDPKILEAQREYNAYASMMVERLSMPIVVKPLSRWKRLQWAIRVRWFDLRWRLATWIYPEI